MSLHSGTSSDSGRSTVSSTSSTDSDQARFHRSLLQVASSVMALTKGDQPISGSARQVKVTQAVVHGLAESLKYLTDMSEKV